MKEGSDVIYKNKETYVELINKDGTCVIANPEWDWDEEAQFTDSGEDYSESVPYWITVKNSEITLIQSKEK